jgi:hypothetical protein
MPWGSIRPLRLDAVMAEQSDVWQSIANKHKLQYSTIEDVANWGYIDATLEHYWDEMFSHNKTRELEFHHWDNSSERCLNILRHHQDTSILPN